MWRERRTAREGADQSGALPEKRMSLRDEFQLKKIGLSYDNPAHFFSCQVRFNFFFYPFYLEGVGMVINLIVLFDCAIVF